MRILYVAMEHDYGDPARGPSFEETNFRSALKGMGHELCAFDFVAREALVGREQMNRDLVRTAAEQRPDLAFFFIFKDEITPDTIRAVAREGGAPTVNWFADDHWRFEEFTSVFAPAFDWCVTTDHESLPKYEAIGCEQVVQSQWACNRYAYHRGSGEITHQVTFVGQAYGDRPKVVERIRRSGFEVECFGFGWPAGRIDQAAMVDVFGSSAVNLNLSSSWQPEYTPRMRAGALVRGIKLDRRKRRSQIKGRTFEVPGCGGLLLTDRVPHLDRYLIPGKEVALFDSTDELIEQLEFLTTHEAERAAMAEAGYQRVLAEHTYDHRFAAIFAAIGVA